jgi:uncharacterized membrane protein YfcA
MSGLIMLWIFISSLVSSTVGFAFSAIAGAVLLQLGADPVEAVRILLTCSIAIQGYTVATLWRSIAWRRVVPFVLGGLAALPFGILLLFRTPAASYQLALGAFLIGYGLYMLAKPRSIVVAGSDLRDALAGALGGITGGLAAFPGAFVTIWCGMRGWDKDGQRAVYQPYILIMQLAALALITALGSAHGVDPAPLAYVPGAVLGAYGGLAIFRRMTDRQFNIAVYVLLIASGCALVGG